MPSDTILDAVWAQFSASITAYYPQLVAIGLSLFGTIVLLQFSYICARAILRGHLHGILNDILLGIIRIGIVWGVLTVAAGFGGSIVDTCRGVAEQIAGVPLTPSGVWDIGGQIVATIRAARTWMSFLDPTQDLIFGVVIAITYVIYLIAALLYLWVLIQAVYVVVIGAILLPFSVFEATFSMLYKWFEDVLGVGMKLLAVILLLAIGMNVASGWAADYAVLGKAMNNAQLYYALRALGESIIFCAMVGGFPYVTARMVRSHMGGGMSWDDAGAWSMMRSASRQGQNAAREVARAGAQVASGGNLGGYVRSKLLR